jgi:hypothetical protein
VAALLQCGISGGSTINNQLKASTATEMETATMLAMTTRIKTKVTVAAVAAWQQRGGQRGGQRSEQRGGGVIFTSAQQVKQGNGGGKHLNM